MTNTQHTQGPWHTEENHPKFGGYYIHHNADETQNPNDIVADNIRTLANAKLIAAAPDMLAALEQVQTNHEYNGTEDTEEYKIVCAAISKARGD